tara:strand:+ start:513 stop:881 length:369 start_codon:yes stop_codon:yes gene_type:complete
MTEDIIIKSANELPRIEIFPKVFGKFFPSGNKAMMMLVEISAKLSVPKHKHKNEQMGLCISGKAEFISGKEKKIVEKDTSYYIASNIEHSVKVISKEKGIFLDIFIPPRKDYREKIRNVKNH